MHELLGPDKLLLTQTQIKRIGKAKANGKGLLRKQGGILGALLGSLVAALLIGKLFGAGSGGRGMGKKE